MNQKLLKEIRDLSVRAGFVFITSSSAEGVPHLSTSGPLEILPGNRIESIGWHCPGILRNILVNPICSIVAWDMQVDRGFQIVGTVTANQAISSLDGYAPGIDDRNDIPQTQYRFVMIIEYITGFRRAPHNDLP